MNSSILKALLTKYRDTKWTLGRADNRTIKALHEFSESIKTDRELTNDEQFHLVTICLEVDRKKHLLTTQITDELLGALGHEAMIRNLKKMDLLNVQTYSIILKYPSVTHIVELIELLDNQIFRDSYLEKLMEYQYPNSSLEALYDCLSLLDSDYPQYLSDSTIHLLLEYAKEARAIENVRVLLMAYHATGILNETQLKLLSTQLDSIRQGEAYEDLVKYVLANQLNLLELQMLIITNKDKGLAASIKALSDIPNLSVAIKERALITMLNSPEHQHILITAFETNSRTYVSAEAFGNYKVLLDHYKFADKLINGMILISRLSRHQKFNTYMGELKNHSEYALELGRVFCTIESVSLSNKAINELCDYLSGHPEQAENLDKILTALIKNSLYFKNNTTKLIQNEVINEEFASILTKLSAPPILSLALLDKLISQKDSLKQIAPAIQRLSEIKKLTADHLNGILDNPKNSDQLVNQYCRSNYSPTYFKSENLGGNSIEQRTNSSAFSPSTSGAY